METLKFIITNSTPPFSVGGDAYHVYLLSTELVKMGHDVHIFCSRDSYDLLAKLYNQSVKNEYLPANNGLSIHMFSSRLKILDPIITYSIGKSNFYYNKYLELLKDIRPDVVHHHDVTFLGFNLFNRQKNYCQLYTSHNYWLICPNREFNRFGKMCSRPSLCSLCLVYSKRPPQIWRLTNNVNDIIKDIDTIIFPSLYIKDKLTKTLDMSDKKMTCIYNFTPRIDKDIKPCRYRDYYLYVGRLEEGKGIVQLVNTFIRHINDIDQSLIIIGNGSLKSRIEYIIKKHRVENKILLLGYINDKNILLSLYKNALALIVPSVWPENNPMVALEAISLGTPVIGTNQGGIPEIIENIDKNLIFNFMDFEELYDILINFDRKIYLPRKILDIYDKLYSPEIYIRNYMNLLDNKVDD